MTFFLMDNSKVCLPAEGNEPVERLKIIIQREQNPGEGGVWVECRRGCYSIWGERWCLHPGSERKWR